MHAQARGLHGRMQPRQPRQRCMHACTCGTHTSSMPRAACATPQHGHMPRGWRHACLPCMPCMWRGPARCLTCSVSSSACMNSWLSCCEPSPQRLSTRPMRLRNVLGVCTEPRLPPVSAASRSAKAGATLALLALQPFTAKALTHMQPPQQQEGCAEGPLPGPMCTWGTSQRAQPTTTTHHAAPQRG